MKPTIEIERFQRLNLRVGTLKGARAHPSIPALSILRVKVDEEVEVLAPTSLITEEAFGKRLVVAMDLHPLVAGSLRFEHCLMPVLAFAGDFSLPTVDAEIPDGAKLS